MDYETPDGSQFSLRTVSVPRSGQDGFDEYTSVSAYVDGVAYTGRLDLLPDEVDEGDILSVLEPVPVECIHPPFRPDFTLAPSFDPDRHYLKAPSFDYEDCRPGNTFVADRVLDEVQALELIKSKPHANLVKYHGCVVKHGRITHLRLEKYPTRLVDAIEAGMSREEREGVYHGIKKGLEYLHSLNLAHNDISLENVCMDSAEQPVVIDFDSCIPFGQQIMKGTATESSDSRLPVSCKENDLRGLSRVHNFLQLEGGG